MFDRHFLTSKLGFSAVISVVAMVTFNVYAVTQQIGLKPPVETAAAAPMVELA